MNNYEIAAPVWKSVMVTRHLPEELSGLETLCKNLWWCWNDNAKALFRTVDYDLWHRSGHNPMVILDKVSLKRYKELAKDKAFLGQLDEVMAEFNAYMAEKEKRTEPSVGYFCMEYGLDTSLMIYSGGLGILAGDYLKETSDMNINLVAVGLLYRFGYFTQRLTPQGNQVAEYKPQDFMKIPAEPVLDENGAWKTIQMQMPGRVLHARIWKVAVGRTDLYLLDTDYEANIPEDREVTHQLYGGNWENRLKQELLLGIGGVRALRVLGLRPSILHYNEGHAAFAGLEFLRECIQEKHLSFSEGLELVRAASLYTTHTPVPAGHDAFTEDMIGRYIGHYPRTSTACPCCTARSARTSSQTCIRATSRRNSISATSPTASTIRPGLPSTGKSCTPRCSVRNSRRTTTTRSASRASIPCLTPRSGTSARPSRRN